MFDFVDDGSIVKVVSSGTVNIEVLKTGDIRKILCGETMVNQIIGNYLDGMAQNIYLRVKQGSGYKIFPLMGSASNAVVSFRKNQIVYSGCADEIGYEVFLSPLTNKWFYDVFLYPNGSAYTVDLIYAQDVGLGSPGHVRGNEAYNAQYIDHSVFETKDGKTGRVTGIAAGDEANAIAGTGVNGYTVCSRQNQRQQTGFPFLQQGSLNDTVSFSTDGYHFFGLSYKFTNQPEALQKPQLDNRVYQYEFAYTALQSKPMTLTGNAQVTFYALLNPTINTSVHEPVGLAEILAGRETLAFEHTMSADNKGKSEKAFVRSININDTYASLPLTRDELDRFYPNKRHIETENDTLLSFFTDENAHVVLGDKELCVERSHGHIILTGDNDFVKDELAASTSYIYGVFHSQVVEGNTSMNQFITNCRNGLNVSKSPGLRIMMEIDGHVRLLTMPAVYEMGFNYAKWLYKLDGDMLEIIAYALLDKPLLKLEVRSHQNKSYRFIVFAQMCDSPVEEKPVPPQRDGNAVITFPHPESLAAQTYPGLSFAMGFDRAFTLHDDRLFYPSMGTQGEPVLAMELLDAGFTLTLEPRIDGRPVPDTKLPFAEEARRYRDWLRAGINDFRLEQASGDADVDAFNDLALWYSLNARVHYASPHGLEQFGGAAWGTRDVCQGPFEYFLATQKFNVIRDILLKVFSHQYREDGDWPQWFMFDRYSRIQSYGSHGDIVVWPVKAVADYLLATRDDSLLSTVVPYTTTDGFGFTTAGETVFLHIKKAIDRITGLFYEGTRLSGYGEGDWDDTLQPADPSLRHKMVSAWTVALTYQAFSDLAKALKDFDPAYSDSLTGLASGMKDDFHRYLVKDGQTAGFAVFENGTSEPRYLLHPSDRETGLTHRLIPMTRSMIAGLFTEEEAARHYALIHKHLYHPDGVRLMNNTCIYKGGVNTLFMRAETAANFGREIGLQYVHAHIRFIEAMAKTGRAEEAWLGLKRINPVRIRQSVPNALPRQRNCYFSSSDGAFDNRYEAMRDFDKLRTGEIPVKAGWRIYSSGSGIYLNQLITRFLGLRINGGKLILDPVMPKELDGLVFSYAVLGKKVCIRYHIENEYGVERVTVDGKDILFETEKQPYRKGGAVFPIECVQPDSVIEVWV